MSAVGGATTEVARSSSYLHQHSHWLIEVPIRIVVVIVVSLLIRALVHRAINRLTTPVHVGEVPRILRPFKERVQNSSFLESTGLLSERRTQRAATIGSVLKSAASLIVLVFAFLTVLHELGIDLAPFIAGTSIVGVALGFGAQNVVKDFLSGMFMMLEDQYGVGDVIDFEKATGTVEAVGLRTTRLRDANGTVWYVRNGEVVRVGNMSQGYAQVVLDVPIDTSVDVARASTAILDEAQHMHDEDDWSPHFLSDPDLQGVESMTREETVIRLVARTRPGEQFRIARELRTRVRKRLDRLRIPAGEPAATTSAPGAGGIPPDVSPDDSPDGSVS